MFQGLLTKIFGSRNQRLLKQYQQVVARVNAFEPALKTLTDEALSGKTAQFRQRLGQGESLDALLPEAFAVCREASSRVMGMRHFDVQLLGGMVLHHGKIAEMRTGEGKTLMATLPAYLNALLGQGVHVVTVNDYLAARDAEWMGRLYRFLGLSVGVIVSQQENAAKRDAYAADSQVSYYLKGAVVALCLDLQLRRDGSCLPAVLQQLWRSHGRCRRGYAEADLLQAFTDHSPALGSLLPAWLDGLDDPDLDGYLCDVGLRLEAEMASTPWAGITTT
ncbi:MAG: hypothetical protein EBW88_12885, partial [Betaproteobacteria bacterium]|nr:hypothetical protein [Betaproteobacteria bacterium]